MPHPARSFSRELLAFRFPLPATRHPPTVISSRSPLAALVAALLIAHLPANAQVARGTVRDAASVPLAGAVVALVPDSGAISVAGFTDSLGAYQLGPAPSGTYRLRAERIGFAAQLSLPFALGAADTVVRDVTLVPKGQLLAPVRVSAARVCEVSAEEGRDVAALWDDVRTALNATIATGLERRIRLDVTMYERVLDRRLREQRRQERKEVARGGVVFASTPADRLAREGYVVRAGRDFIYRGLDAAVLLSEAFLAGHCFRVAPATEGDSLTGLAFEPAERPDNVDVSGVLWVRPGTRELVAIDFEYENLRINIPQSDLGGRVEFERLPSGRWIVDRWWIRMPRITREEMGRGVGNTVLYRDRLDGFHEAGGEVVRIDPPPPPTSH